MSGPLGLAFYGRSSDFFHVARNVTLEEAPLSGSFS